MVVKILMIQNLAIDVTKSFASAGEALGYGLPLYLFGFCVVFFVLALLWGILTLFKLFFYTIPHNKKNSDSSAPAKDSSSVQKTEMTSSGAAAAVLDPSQADNEIVAAITAAIEAFRSQNGSVGGFRVVSFKKRK